MVSSSPLAVAWPRPPADQLDDLIDADVELPRLGQQGIDALGHDPQPLAASPTAEPASETYVPAVRRFSTTPSASSSR